MGSETEVEAAFHSAKDSGTTLGDPGPQSAPSESNITGTICINVMKQVISTQ